MSELHDLQQSFQDYVLSGNKIFKGNVEGSDEQFITTRSEIYHSAYRLRLIGVLKIDYPGLHTLAGDEQFDMICEDYIKHYPSDHFSVRYFGRFMQEFLKNTDPYAKHRMLADIAGFEWAVSEALDAEDQHVLSIDELQNISPALWPEMKIKLHSSFRTLSLEWNAPKFWQSVNEEQDPEAPVKYEKAVSWILWRKGIEIYFRSLPEDEAWLINAVIERKNFAELCEGLCEWVEPNNVAVRVAGFLHNWIAEEMVSLIETA